MALNPFLQVKIKPRNIGLKLSSMERTTKRRYREFVETIIKLTEVTMKGLVPVRTGTLRDSIRTISKQIQEGGVDLRSNSFVGTTLRYAGFVDKGTKPSRGVFVPFLGRRIQTGVHPGTPASNFIQRTKEVIDMELGFKGQNFLNRMRSDFNRIK